MWNISIENSFQKGCSSSHLRPDQPLLGLEDSQGTDFSPSALWGVSIPSSDALIGDRAGCDCVCIWWHSVCSSSQQAGTCSAMVLIKLLFQDYALWSAGPLNWADDIESLTRKARCSVLVPQLIIKNNWYSVLIPWRAVYAQTGWQQYHSGGWLLQTGLCWKVEGAVILGNVRDDALQLYLSVNTKASQTRRLAKRKHSLKSWSLLSLSPGTLFHLLHVYELCQSW